MAEANDVLEELAGTVADLGPAIEPPGYGELLTWITRTARDLTGAAAASIAVLDDEEGILEFVAATGAGSEQVIGITMDASKGIAGWALASGQSITIADAPSDPRFAADVAEETGYTPRSVFAIPLESDGDPVGVMEILDAEEGRELAREESHLISTLARQAAVAIETTRLFRDLGTTMLRAAAETAEGGDVSDALERAAEEARGPSKDLATLLEVFHELGKLGAPERKAATDLLITFLRFAYGNRS